MVKFILPSKAHRDDYPTLGFSVDADGAILDGTLFTPDLEIPPDAYWEVYEGGDPETDITRYATPSADYLQPPAEVTDGWFLAYDTGANTYVPQDPADLIETGAWATPLSAAYVRYVTDLNRAGGDAAGNTAKIQAALDAGGVVRIEGTGTVAYTELTLPEGGVLEGSGREGGVTLHHVGSGNGITTVEDITAGEIRNFTMTAAAGSDALVKIAAGFRAVRLVNIRMSPVGKGVDASAGDGVDLYMENVRVNGGSGPAFDLVSTGVTINTITAVSCYAQGSSGRGWATANVLKATFIGCAADGNAGGWQLGGNVTLIGCSAEVNTLYGFAVLGVGHINFLNCSTYLQVVPYRVDALADVTFDHIIDAETVGSVSLEISAAATGELHMMSHELTEDISVAVGARLIRHDEYDQRGEFTPTLYGATTPGAHTYTTQTGIYNVVGGMVFVRVSLRIDNAGWDAACAGNLRIGGLPSPLLAAARDIGAPAPVNFNYFNLGAGYYTVWAKINGSNYIELCKNGTGFNENYLAAADRGAGTAVLIDFWAVWAKADIGWTNL